MAPLVNKAATASSSAHSRAAMANRVRRVAIHPASKGAMVNSNARSRAVVMARPVRRVAMAHVPAARPEGPVPRVPAATVPPEEGRVRVVTARPEGPVVLPEEVRVPVAPEEARLDQRSFW